MADNERLICASDELAERGPGVRFEVPELGQRVTGFVVRYEGKVYGFVNQCAHIPVELDWNEGDFFNISRDHLICSTHGAQYDPTTGYCVLGPCKGRSLATLPIIERGQQILLILESTQNK
ncbi:MAG TPA: Rieske 2Fe-2S domain-containing protein [Methylophilaceae bacterium]|nr:Rieske 2Fe-2S domain-containing protein [Methylophilaceae bacterium]